MTAQQGEVERRELPGGRVQVRAAAIPDMLMTTADVAGQIAGAA